MPWPDGRRPPSFTIDDLGRMDAKSRFRSAQAVARALAKEINASPKLSDLPPRKYVTAKEAVAGFGLAPGLANKAEGYIRELVNESRSMFDVARAMRKDGFGDPLIRELLRRGQGMAQESRAAARRNGVIKSVPMPSGAGWEPIPRGKRGGFRRRKPGGGYEYAYPDEGGTNFTRHDEPAADEHEDTHAEHAKATPKPEVAAAYEKVRKKAEAAGLSLDNHPGAGTTLEHIKAVEAQVDRAIAQQGKRDKDRHPDEHRAEIRQLAQKKGVSEAHLEEELAAAGDDPDKLVGLRNRVADVGDLDDEALEKELSAILDVAERAGVDLEDVETAIREIGAERSGLKTLREHLEQLASELEDKSEGDNPKEGTADPGSDLPPATGDNPADRVPKDPEERKALQEHVDGLDGALDRIAELSKEVEAYKALHAKLKAELEEVRRRPTHNRVVYAQSRVRSWAILLLGAAAGAALLGPFGVLLGLTVANRGLSWEAQTAGSRAVEREPKEKQFRRALAAGRILVAGDRLVVADPIPRPLIAPPVRRTTEATTEGTSAWTRS